MAELCLLLIGLVVGIVIGQGGIRDEASLQQPGSRAYDKSRSLGA